MSQTNVTLHLPGLLPSVKGDSAQHPLSELQLPALQKLLARAKLHTSLNTPNLANYFGLTEPLAEASLRAIADGLNPQQGYYLCVDPVQLHIDQAAVYLMGYEQLQLSATDNQTLFEIVQQLLPESATLLRGESQRWYIHTAQALDLTCTALATMVGKDITAQMPQGADATSWKRLLTEIQMSLHSAPFNQQRQSEGRVAANSVWFWGGGVLPEGISAVWQKVWHDDLLAKGLALQANIAEDEMANFNAAQLNANGEYLMALQALSSFVSHGAISAWQHTMQQLEQCLFLPLLDALLNGDIKTITLYAGGGMSYTINKKVVKQWWRKKKTLMQWVSTV